jgi:hypothetical protein
MSNRPRRPNESGSATLRTGTNGSLPFASVARPHVKLLSGSSSSCGVG